MKEVMKEIKKRYAQGAPFSADVTTVTVMLRDIERLIKEVEARDEAIVKLAEYHNAWKEMEKVHNSHDFTDDDIRRIFERERELREDLDDELKDLVYE